MKNLLVTIVLLLCFFVFIAPILAIILMTALDTFAPVMGLMR